MEYPNAKQERDDFLTVDALVEHSGMSKRKLMTYLHHPVTPIPHRRIGQRIYVLVSEYRAWAEQFRVTPQTLDVRALVDELAPARGLRRRLREGR